MFKVYVYSLLTKTSTAYDVIYTATDNVYSKPRKGVEKVFPHNF